MRCRASGPGILGLDFVDMPLSSGYAPSRERLLALVEALRTMREPGLVHCKSGADRAGFAAAVFLLLQGASVAQAMGQLSLRWGHLAQSRAGVLDAVLNAYRGAAEGRRPFAEWVRDDYDPDRLQAGFRTGRLSILLQEQVLRRE